MASSTVAHHQSPGRHSRVISAGLYARVSTADQNTENQLTALRSFAEARGWAALEFVDHGVSGAKERRPALDALLSAVRSRKTDVVVCTKLDRLARSVHHLVSLGKELEALGVDLVALDQTIDTTTASGRLLFHVLAAIAEFERDLIRDRVIAGIRRARAQGRRIGRPRQQQVDLAQAIQLREQGLSLRAVARQLGVHPTAVSRALTTP
jgi:DNA invertase Pin-like site-specific DNA recombinase